MKNAIYGAGQLGDYLFRAMNPVVDIDFFIDAYTSAKELHGKPILKPNEAPRATIYNSVHFFDEAIVKQLTQKEHNVISFSETLKRFPNFFSTLQMEKFLWFDNKKNLLDDKLNVVAKLFKDEKSIKIFNKLMMFRKSFDMAHYPYPNEKLSQQYFPKDIPIVPKNDEFRFIDCGAFTGDTIELVYANVPKNKKTSVISFEPDPTNIKAFQENSKKFSNIEIVLIPMGVYSQTKILKFSLLGSGSNISHEGDVAIPVTTLDETIYSFRPNYIKMDIEGVEKEALLGAKHTIKEFTPNLAISLYHKPEDLWELPLLIQEINPNYQFYIRTHAHLGIETVLYCVRKNYD